MDKINVIACVKSGEIEGKPLYKCICLVNGQDIVIYTTVEKEPGIYNPKLAKRFIETKDGKKKPYLVATIGELA